MEVGAIEILDADDVDEFHRPVVRRVALGRDVRNQRVVVGQARFDRIGLNRSAYFRKTRTRPRVSPNDLGQQRVDAFDERVATIVALAAEFVGVGIVVGVRGGVQIFVITVR